MGKGRAPCCDKSQVKRGPWSPAEDLRLISFIQKHGHDNWRALPKQAGLLRCGKSCRLRWINYLRPDVKRGNFTQGEEEAIIKLHETLGNKWSKIASHFPGRTDNEIKNIWNTHLKKKLPFVKNSDSSIGDESKEYSSTTSSSSSSFSSNPSCGKRGLETELRHQSDDESVPKRPCNDDEQLTIVREKLIDHDVQKEVTNPNDQLVISNTTTTTTSTTTSASSHASNMSNSTNSTTQAGVSRDVDHDQEDDQMVNNLLFDFMGPHDVSDILQEVNKPDIQADLMAPLEADYEFWNMLENLGTNFLQQPNDQVQSQGSNLNGEEHKGENIDSWDWIRALENELGLPGNDNQNKQIVLEDQSHAVEEQAPAEMYFHYDVEEKLQEESDPCLTFTNYNQFATTFSSHLIDY